jgi:hypothetical protein
LFDRWLTNPTIGSLSATLRISRRVPEKIIVSAPTSNTSRRADIDSRAAASTDLQNPMFRSFLITRHGTKDDNGAIAADRVFCTCASAGESFIATTVQAKSRNSLPRTNKDSKTVAA